LWAQKRNLEEGKKEVHREVLHTRSQVRKHRDVGGKAEASREQKNWGEEEEKEKRGKWCTRSGGVGGQKGENTRGKKIAELRLHSLGPRQYLSQQSNGGGSADVEGKKKKRGGSAHG